MHNEKLTYFDPNYNKSSFHKQPNLTYFFVERGSYSGIWQGQQNFFITYTQQKTNMFELLNNLP